MKSFKSGLHHIYRRLSGLQQANLAKQEIDEGLQKWLSNIINIQPWCVDHLEWSAGQLMIRGWAIPPAGDHQRYCFKLNDANFAEVNYPLLRDDITSAYWFLPGASKSGFECVHEIEKPALKDVCFEKFSFVDKQTGQQVPPGREYYYCTGGESLALPVPDPVNRHRVHGGESLSAFMLEGASIFQRLSYALHEVANRDYSDFQSILDWGCGCGRVTRYFADVSGPSITGVDIDPDNINWSSKNLPFAKFIKTDLHPPTQFDENQFDLLIGTSVFTHLSEPDHLDWLKELNRISRSGAILLMSIHGSARIGLNMNELVLLEENGYLDQKSDPILNQVIHDNEYYRKAFQSHNYVRQRWSEYFRILDILPSAIGNNQDLVVMEKP